LIGSAGGGIFGFSRRPACLLGLLTVYQTSATLSRPFSFGPGASCSALCACRPWPDAFGSKRTLLYPCLASWEYLSRTGRPAQGYLWL